MSKCKFIETRNMSRLCMGFFVMLLSICVYCGLYHINDGYNRYCQKRSIELEVLNDGPIKDSNVIKVKDLTNDGKIEMLVVDQPYKKGDLIQRYITYDDLFEGYTNYRDKYYGIIITLWLCLLIQFSICCITGDSCTNYTLLSGTNFDIVCGCLYLIVNIMCLLGFIMG